MSATAVRYPQDLRIDTGTTAYLTFPSSKPGGAPVKSTIKCDFSAPPHFGFIPRWPEISVLATCESGSVELFNFIMPVIYHSITVKREHDVPRTEKAYTFQDDSGKGEDWWSTYRYQLEAFVDKVKGRTPQTWMSAEDSIANMEWIEKIYEEVSALHLSAIVCLIRHAERTWISTPVHIRPPDALTMLELDWLLCCGTLYRTFQIKKLFLYSPWTMIY